MNRLYMALFAFWCICGRGFAEYLLFPLLFRYPFCCLLVMLTWVSVEHFVCFCSCFFFCGFCALYDPFLVFAFVCGIGLYCWLKEIVYRHIIACTMDLLTWNGFMNTWSCPVFNINLCEKGEGEFY